MFSDLALKYLEEHALTPDKAKVLGITESEGYLNIPIEELNEEGVPVVTFQKRRNLNYVEGDPNSSKYKNAVGSHAALFNYPSIIDKKYVFVCEGEMDCIKLTTEDIPAVSTTGGSGVFLTEWGELLKDKKVYICYDSDTAGVSGVRKVLSVLPHAKVVNLPDKDVCEFFRQGKTKEDFLACARVALTKSEWELSNLPDDFAVVSANTLVKREFTEEPYIIDKVLYGQGFCFFFGAEGVGKSLLALSVAKAVSTGEAWLGEFEVHKQVGVLFLDKENPLSMVSRRARAMGVDMDNVYWLEYPEKFQLSDGNGNASEFAEALSIIIKERNIGLIIVDSFVDLMTGNESSSGDTQSFFDAMRLLYPNIAYLVLHHENKPAQGVVRSDNQRIRGSTNIGAQTFTAFRLEQIASTELTIKQTKARDTLKIDKFQIRMEVSDVDGRNMVTGFTYCGTIADVLDDKIEATEDMITTILSEEGAPVSRSKLMELTGAADRTLRRALKKMEDTGAVIKTRDGRGVSYTLKILDPIVYDDPNSLFTGNL